MSRSADRCPACRRPVTTLDAFQGHHPAVARHAQHVAALWTLLGIDYAALQGDDPAQAEQRARERGWTLL